MSPRFFFNTLIRESRGARGRLAFFVACLSVGVAAVVAVEPTGAETHLIAEVGGQRILASFRSRTA